MNNHKKSPNHNAKVLDAENISSEPVKSKLNAKPVKENIDIIADLSTNQYMAVSDHSDKLDKDKKILKP